MAENVLGGREVIIEFYTVGNAVRVSAIDVETLIEISIQGPVDATESVLKNNAVKKLEYVMKKKGLL